MLLIFLTSVASLLAWYLYNTGPRPKNFPPGPQGIPIFGNALQLGKHCCKSALDLQKQYGDIIGVRMGTHWTVILNNPEDIREAFNKPEFCGRIGFNPIMDTTTEALNSGIAFSQGVKWVEIQRFTLRSMQKLFFANRTSEGIIMEETRDVIQRLQQLVGKPISTRGLLNAAALNILWSFVAGERYNPEEIEDFMKLFYSVHDATMKGIRPFYFLFPGLVRFRKFFSLILFERNDEFRYRLFELFKKPIDEHRKTMQAGQPRDYIDALLEESSNMTDFKDEDLLVTLMDLFIGGSELTGKTLVSGLCLLSQHVEVQDKMANEITTLVGSRSIMLSDKQSLPYVEATVLEIMRLSRVVTVGLPHAVTEDVVFKGFSFPKNTMVISNIYGCLKSQKIWGDPEVFRPERFLGPDGKSVVRHKAMLPFSTGRRSCIGKSLAQDEIFLMLANLIHQFCVTLPEDVPVNNRVSGKSTEQLHRIIVNNRY